jgi:tol-pal system protein YbgF
MMRRASALALAALVVAGPAIVPLSAANREHEQMMADIRMLQEQNQQLQRALATLTEALRTVTARIDEQAETQRKSFADQKLLVDNLAGDLRVVREKIDETNVRLNSLSQEIEGVRAMMPQPGAMSPLPPPGSTDATSTQEPTAGNAAPSPLTPAQATGTTPKSLYDAALGDYMGGQWSLAISGFQTYLNTYPKSEQADDAQYYIGESYAGDSKFKEAAAAYERVIESYPQSDILALAWYKLGLAYDRLGQADRARDAFDRVVKNYPDSDAGRLARQNLERLNRRR